METEAPLLLSVLVGVSLRGRSRSPCAQRSEKRAFGLSTVRTPRARVLLADGALQARAAGRPFL
eukprot:scaffold21841_cov155-Isochrysis_galbana.AAC.1